MSVALRSAGGRGSLAGELFPLAAESAVEVPQKREHAAPERDTSAKRAPAESLHFGISIRSGNLSSAGVLRRSRLLEQQKRADGVQFCI